MKKKSLCLLGALAMALLWPGISGAQTDELTDQYTEPGSLAKARERAAERVKRERDEARWKFGKLRVDPRFWLRDAGYYDNVFAAPDEVEPVSDLSITGGAGLVAFLNLGPKVIASVFALPEYVWWQDLDDLSGLHGEGGAEIFGLFNRATIEVGARRRERQRQLNSEIEIPVDVTLDVARLDFSLDLARRLSLFGGFTAREIRHEDLAPAESVVVPTSPLDRDEELGRLGLRYALSDTARLGFGVERSETDFETGSRGRSSTGTSPFVALDSNGDRVVVNSELVLRTLEFGDDGVFDIEEVTGKIRIGWNMGTQSLFAIYGARSLVYSALSQNSFYLDQRLGAALETGLGRSLRGQVFAEQGEADYANVDDTLNPRRDDLSAVGAALSLRLTSQVSVQLRGSRTELESNLPDLDRSVTRFGLNLRLGEDFFLR